MQEAVWEVDGAGDTNVSKMKTLPPSATAASALFGACVNRTQAGGLGSYSQGSFLCSLSLLPRSWPPSPPLWSGILSLCPALTFLACCVVVILGDV